MGGLKASWAPLDASSSHVGVLAARLMSGSRSGEAGDEWSTWDDSETLGEGSGGPGMSFVRSKRFESLCGLG